MGSIDAWLASMLVAHGVDLLRLEATYQRVVLALLLEMERELVDKLTGKKPITEWSRQRLTDMLADARSLIASTYVDIKNAMDPLPIMKMEADYTTKVLKEGIGTKLVTGSPSASTLAALAQETLIQGAPSAAWWSRQGSDTAFRFANAVRQGIAQGETNAQIVGRVAGTKTQPGVMDTSQRNAEALVRTSVQTVTNEARLAVFENNADVLEGIEQVSTLDSRTTNICIAYDGATWGLDEAHRPIAPNKLPYNGGCPRHWGCRSSIVPKVKPLVAGLEGFNPSERASEHGPTRAKTFSAWLDGKSKSYQDRLLGPGRAELFRDGKMTLPQLLDQSGRPLTLKQLEESYA